MSRPGLMTALPMLSAHRSGAELDPESENRLPTLISAAASDCEFVEFDVQRCSDGVFVLRHDHDIVVEGARVLIESLSHQELLVLEPETVTLEAALAVLKGQIRAHVDFKFISPVELYATPALTYEVITTAHDASVKAVRQWSRNRHPSLLVGLSLGRRTDELRLREKIAVRFSEVFGAAARLRACDANLVVANKELARLRLAHLAWKLHLPLLVWTVDPEEELEYWLNDPRAWLVTTNYPNRALSLRAV